MPDGFKVIEKFDVGDKVLTADMQLNGGGLKLNWSGAKVSMAAARAPIAINRPWCLSIMASWAPWWLRLTIYF